MMRLNDREWKDFAVPEIFQNIKRGKRLKNADHISGKVPYISSTANNNGVDDYIEASEGTRVFKNCISLANSGSVGAAFYEPFAFVASDHVTSLGCKEANKYIYLFLTAVLKQQASNFNFNREINDIRIKKMRIMLPVTETEEPDYQFMEDYVRELMAVKMKQYRVYIEARLKFIRLDNTNQMGYRDRLKSCEWKAFRLEDLFECTKGVYLPTDTVQDGDIPFITAKAGNNGVNGFIGNGILFSGGRITIEKIRLSAYYQTRGFYCSHDVSVIYNEHLNEYNAQFIANIIMRNGSKYSYGRQAQLNVVKREVIMLPVTDDGQPDYDFMEEAGKKMMLNKYDQYLRFLSSQENV